MIWCQLNLRKIDRKAQKKGEGLGRHGSATGRGAQHIHRRINALGRKERKKLTAALREPNTFLVEYMTGVLVILQTLKKITDTNRRPPGEYFAQQP
jgi:hypothetical protein